MKNSKTHLAGLLAKKMSIPLSPHTARRVKLAQRLVPARSIELASPSHILWAPLPAIDQWLTCETLILTLERARIFLHCHGGERVCSVCVELSGGYISPQTASSSLPPLNKPLSNRLPVLRKQCVCIHFHVILNMQMNTKTPLESRKGISTILLECPGFTQSVLL